MTTIQEAVSLLIDNVETVIQDKRQVIQMCLAALFSGGHVLLEDVPGTGKTVLARALALSVQGEFKRIQFTPDLLPSDITGVSVLQPGGASFQFRPGPIFGNIVLADEINRATPRTQSALLEAMAEQQVTCDGFTHKLPDPFFVIATQNPLENYGTYPLPEAQLDRFLIKIPMGYPSESKEIAILKTQKISHPITNVHPIIAINDVKTIQEAVREVPIHDDMYGYIVELVGRTRTHRDLRVGASPRASLALMRLAQAFALMSGVGFVLPDHVKHAFLPVLNHRVVLSHEAAMRNAIKDDILLEILSYVPVPVIRGSGALHHAGA